MWRKREATKRPADRKRYFTIMLVPHSEKAVLSFRIPWYFLELLFALLGAAAIALLVFTNSYQKMSSDLFQLQQLRRLSQEQKEQIDFLSQQAQEVQQNLRKVEELENQVRKLMKLDASAAPPSPGSGALATSDRGLPDLRERLLSGELGGPTRYRPDARDAARRGDLGVGGPALASARSGAALDLASVASLYQTLASLSTGQQALEAQRDFRQAQQQSQALVDSLQKLKQAVAEQQAFLAAKPSLWPAAGEISSGFGYRGNPYGWGSEFHSGVDIAAPFGTPVLATGDGVIEFSGWAPGYGQKIEISHGYGFGTAYGHLSRRLVQVGDHVKKGQEIGLVGSTGRSTGPHVHYEVLINGQFTNPVNYLSE